MVWENDQKLTLSQSCGVALIRCGRIPRHVAFVMDGNRRYAKKCNIPSVQGHERGFGKFTEVLMWCYALGIREATAYAFSIRNFNRSKEELDNMFGLVQEKLHYWISEKMDEIIEKGIRIRVIGNMSYLSADVQKVIADVVSKTKDNSEFFLNLAIAYTSTDEITQAVLKLMKCSSDGVLIPDDISQDVLYQCLQTYDSPPVDLLIRTSGETRLSDYLLWQVSSSYLYFTPALWPDFSVWHLLAAVFRYQHNYDCLQNVEKVEKSTMCHSLHSKRREHVYGLLKSLQK